VRSHSARRDDWRADRQARGLVDERHGYNSSQQCEPDHGAARYRGDIEQRHVVEHRRHLHRFDRDDGAGNHDPVDRRHLEWPDNRNSAWIDDGAEWE
jgi:hypothetical protein